LTQKSEGNGEALLESYRAGGGSHRVWCRGARIGGFGRRYAVCRRFSATGEVRPLTRWHWLNGDVTEAGITGDLPFKQIATLLPALQNLRASIGFAAIAAVAALDCKVHRQYPGVCMSVVESSTHTLKNGSTVTIRSANVEDAAAILRHARDMLVDNDFASREVDEFGFTVETETKLIEEHRFKLGSLWLIAEHEGVIVGSVMFSTGTQRRLAHRGSLGIGLERAWRRQGLGTLLMQRLLTWAEQEPTVEKVCLAVFAANTAAIRLYRKLGFIEEGRRIREIKLGPEHYVDDILMYRWVKSTVL
jgi:RimJ/RimL family protein N-acetyltransferase